MVCPIDFFFFLGGGGGIKHTLMGKTQPSAVSRDLWKLQTDIFPYSVTKKKKVDKISRLFLFKLNYVNTADFGFRLHPAFGSGRPAPANRNAALGECLSLAGTPIRFAMFLCRSSVQLPTRSYHDWKRQRWKGSWEGWSQASQEGVEGQHPGYHEACHQTSGEARWS